MASEAAEAVFPAGTMAVGLDGAYDYRYAAQGLIDVPADGRVHNVPLATCRAPVETTLVVVPRESLQAVRLATMKNPLAAPLLAGPADVYLEDEFLVSTPLRQVPAGATLSIGLGVEEALKVARNTFYTEEVAGLLRGGAMLSHRVEIEVASRLPKPVRVEVRERVPVKDESEEGVTVAVTKVDPGWDDFDQNEVSRIKGGKRWLFSLAPGEQRKLVFGYDIRIEGKRELVGGNRRENA